MKKVYKWTLIGIFMVVLGIGVAYAGTQRSRGETSSVAEAPKTGYKMPAFTLKEYPDNKPVSTDSLQGKPIFINFWTSWCTYCRLETPDIVKAYQKYGKQVVFLSVNITSEDSVQAMANFVHQYGMTWPVALDRSGKVSKEYQVVGIPTSFFVSRQGIIVAKNVGSLSAGTLNADLKRIAS
ncbi:TlpA disulfide reductase family protein [Alicyclobacillus sp. SO9]|uniref:TlpA family protein disulfide reductase n=1 Tax=Alicyclobacillus sp. SO9 TaxID=2665646 RepID=UPI0018E7B87B|nr:TlpA disulfide reductase family protein [Alicyclobacillus sp. SO9]QQE78455.1 TlpA family protein disulfide reductase [Alicyclobacillus sp. SO9]